MNFLESKLAQLIALASIVATLAGFGYTGATYVNRLENLEAQIGGIGDTESTAQKIPINQTKNQVVDMRQLEDKSKK